MNKNTIQKRTRNEYT